MPCFKQKRNSIRHARRIFLSHAGEEKGVALCVARLLYRRGKKPWLDVLKIRERTSEAIMNGIKSCENFVAITSDMYRVKEWCQTEFKMAEAVGKPMVCLRLGNQCYYKDLVGTSVRGDDNDFARIDEFFDRILQCPLTEEEVEMLPVWLDEATATVSSMSYRQIKEFVQDEGGKATSSSSNMYSCKSALIALLLLVGGGVVAIVKLVTTPNDRQADPLIDQGFTSTASLSTPSSTPKGLGNTQAPSRQTMSFDLPTKFPHTDPVPSSLTPSNTASTITSYINSITLSGKGVTYSPMRSIASLSPEEKALAWIIENDAARGIQGHRMRQRYALLTVYYSLNGDKWSFGNQAEIWPISTLSALSYNECQWYGVKCEGDTVTALELASVNAAGSLPHDLGLLDSMTRLTLRDNEITGTLPSGMGSMTI